MINKHWAMFGLYYGYFKDDPSFKQTSGAGFGAYGDGFDGSEDVAPVCSDAGDF